MRRGSARPDPLSVCTNNGLPPPAGRNRMLARRAWKSVNVLHDETSSHLPDTGRPHLEIVRLRARETRIAGGQQNHSVWKSKPLQHRLRVAVRSSCCATESPGSQYRTSSTLSNWCTRSSPRVSFPCAPASRRKHGEYATNAARERGAVEHFVTVEIRDRDLCRRDEKEVVIGERVLLVLELRKLRCPEHGGAVHGERDPHLLVPVLPGMEVEHERHERSHEAGADPAKNDETRPGDLCAASQIDQTSPVGSRDLPVRAHSVDGTRLAPCADDDIRALVTCRDLGQRDVRQLRDDLAERRFDVGTLTLQAVELRAQDTPTIDQLVDRFSVLLAPADFLRNRVALGPLVLFGSNGRASLLLELFTTREGGRHCVQHAPPAQRVTHGVGLIAKEAQVVHRKRRRSIART